MRKNSTSCSSNSDEVAALLLSLDTARLAAAMAEMLPEKIRLIHSMFSENDLRARLYSLSKENRATLSSWTHELRSEIDKLDRKEYYQK